MAEERSSVAGAESLGGGGGNSGGPSLGTTPSGGKLRRASSILHPKTVSKATASVVKGALPGEIDRRHYNVGACLWILLCLAFVAYSIYSIVAMYQARDHPATSFQYVDEDWTYPDVAVCPMAGTWFLWTLAAAGYRQTGDTQYTGISDPSPVQSTNETSNIVQFTNSDGDSCLLIRYGGQGGKGGDFNVNKDAQAWEAAASLAFMTHANLTELNNPKRVRVNYVQDHDYVANAADIINPNSKVSMDDFYTEKNYYYLSYGLGYVVSNVKYLNVLKYADTQPDSRFEDVKLTNTTTTSATSSVSRSTSGQKIPSYSSRPGSDDDFYSSGSAVPADTATSYASFSFHPKYSTSFEGFFSTSYSTDTFTGNTYTSSGSTLHYSVSSGPPTSSSSYYYGDRWQWHDFTSGYFVKKDDNDKWKAMSYDSIMSMAKEVQEPLSPDPKVTLFPSGISASSQYVDVRSMEYFGELKDGSRWYKPSISSGQEVTYMCDTESEGVSEWETKDDLYEVMFTIDFTKAKNFNQINMMYFAGFQVLDYLLGQAHNYKTPDSTTGATGDTGNKTNDGRTATSDISLDPSFPVQYLRWGGFRSSLKYALYRAQKYLGFHFTVDDDDATSSWLWESAEPFSATKGSPAGRRRLGAGGGGAGGAFLADEGIDSDNVIASAERALAAEPMAELEGEHHQQVRPLSPWLFAGDPNRDHAAEATKQRDQRRGSDEGRAAAAARSTNAGQTRGLATAEDEYLDYTDCKLASERPLCLQMNYTMYGGAYYLSLWDWFSNSWLDGNGTITVGYRPKGTTGAYKLAGKSKKEGFVHGNGQEKLTPQFVIGDLTYPEKFPCSTSLDLTDRTAYHLQYMSFTLLNQDYQVEHIVAVDPVDWFAMLGTIGGFWAYVAMVFGVVFVAVAGDDAPPEPVWTMRSQFGYIYEKGAGHLARLKCCVCLRKPVASVTPAKGRDPSLSSTSFLAQMEETKAEGSNTQMAPAFEAESKAGDSAV